MTLLETADTERPPPCQGCPAVESLRVSLEELADVARETRGMVSGLADDLREERRARRSERSDLTQRVHALEVAQTERPEGSVLPKPGKGGALAAALAAIATAAAGVAAALSQ